MTNLGIMAVKRPTTPFNNPPKGVRNNPAASANAGHQSLKNLPILFAFSSFFGSWNHLSVLLKSAPIKVNLRKLIMASHIFLKGFTIALTDFPIRSDDFFNPPSNLFSFAFLSASNFAFRASLASFLSSLKSKRNTFNISSRISLIPLRPSVSFCPSFCSSFSSTGKSRLSTGGLYKLRELSPVVSAFTGSSFLFKKFSLNDLTSIFFLLNLSSFFASS